MSEQEFEVEVTQLLGLVALMRPELVEQFTHAEARRHAVEVLRDSRRRVPRAFLDAFAEPE